MYVRVRGGTKASEFSVLMIRVPGSLQYRVPTFPVIKVVFTEVPVVVVVVVIVVTNIIIWRVLWLYRGPRWLGRTGRCPA